MNYTIMGVRFQAQMFIFLKASASVDTGGGESFPRIERPGSEADHMNVC